MVASGTATNRLEGLAKRARPRGKKFQVMMRNHSVRQGRILARLSKRLPLVFLGNGLRRSRLLNKGTSLSAPLRYKRLRLRARTVHLLLVWCSWSFSSLSKTPDSSSNNKMASAVSLSSRSKAPMRCLETPRPPPQCTSKHSPRACTRSQTKTSRPARPKWFPSAVILSEPMAQKPLLAHTVSNGSHSAEPSAKARICQDVHKPRVSGRSIHYQSGECQV